MKLIGLLITRDDEDILQEWCQDQLRYYEAVICLDGSTTDASEATLRRHANKVIYLHERDCQIPYKTDHGLRRIVHQEIVRRFGTDHWVMCCHADEFCYHDPGRIASKAQQEGFDLVSWYSLHFVPHPSEWTDWSTRQTLPVRARFRHYHWGHQQSERPWLEDRLYRNGPRVHWDQVSHGSVRPHRLENPAPFHPILCHYKVFRTDLGSYEPGQDCTHYRTHWTEVPDRTGLPYPVHRLEDFFVNKLPGYAYCNRFDGTIRAPWNMGEEYRSEEEQP